MKSDVHTGHKLDDVGMSLVEDHLHILRILLLQLLLQVTATMLILAERVDFALKGLELDVGKAVDWNLIRNVAQ
jgi:hypothetical protein